MYQEESLKKVAAAMKKLHDAKIYYHKTPDGDAIGSAHALGLALQSQGVRCELFCEDQVPDRYHFLTDKFKSDKTENAALIALDSSSISRLGNYSDAYDFCIDHHENNTIPAEYKYVDETSSSCSEIIYHLLVLMGIPVTKPVADLLYAGLVTDTSCFRTDSTNADSLLTAAELARCGADVTKIGRVFTMKKTRARIELESVLMNNFRYSCGGKALGCFYTYNDLKHAGTTDLELEGIGAVVDQVEGIDVGFIVREKKPGLCRVSVRTYGKCDASKICREFGGGGHADRAGGNIKGKPEDVMDIVESACGAVLKERS